METLVKEKILEQFVKEIPTESATIQPINVDIKSTDVTRMTTISTMKTNDGNYFIRYGGFVTSSSYNAIEVYSVDSLDNNAAIYVFDNLQIDNHTFFIKKMKQSEDGRFYAVAQYYDGTNTTNYLIIFNNFIQDGYCQINKYYTSSNIGTNDGFFYDVTKVKDAGVYFILTESHLIRFEINILEGDKISIATIVDGDGTISGSYQPQLNVLKDKLIFTKLWETEDYAYEYTKTVIDVNEELSSTITLNRILNLPFTQYVAGAKNNPYEAIIPYLSSGNIYFIKIDINGNINRFGDYSRTFNNNNLNAYLADNYVSVTDNSNLYIYYVIDEGPVDERLIEFYNGTFSGYYSNTQILKQNNIVNLIGTASVGTQQSIVSIKNIYSPNVTSEPYFEYDFCLPYYMNLYSDANDDTSLIFSRDATARFYSGNQITSTFIVPNYLLNDGNIEKASVYGKTNYLLNSEVEDYQKNKFESLYFNFIYNLNVIDNTNGLNTLNQIGSNKVANGLWKTFDNYDLMLTKARITYEDLSTEIINLNLVSLIGGTAIFNYNVNGNITQIEYLSNDESTVYATYKRKISGSHTITQVVKTIPNDIGTANGTSIYISDSSNLTFANIQINGNSVQNGIPIPSNPVEIESAGDTGYITESISNSDNTQSQNFTIPCQQPMRSIGNVRDEFVKENGVWYERHYIASTVLDITEVLVNNSYTNVEYAIIPKMKDDIQYDNYNYGTTIFPLFTKGKDMGALPTGGWDSYIQDGYVYNSATKLYYWMSFAKGTGLTAIRQQLDGMIYNYVLATPTDLLCTQEQIEALESIIRAYTYEPITNINSTDETPAYLNVTYYKQL